jgi:hypothetical protein
LCESSGGGGGGDDDDDDDVFLTLFALLLDVCRYYLPFLFFVFTCSVL